MNWFEGSFIRVSSVKLRLHNSGEAAGRLANAIVGKRTAPRLRRATCRRSERARKTKITHNIVQMKSSMIYEK